MTNISDKYSKLTHPQEPIAISLLIMSNLLSKWKQMYSAVLEELGQAWENHSGDVIRVTLDLDLDHSLLKSVSYKSSNSIEIQYYISGRCWITEVIVQEYLLCRASGVVWGWLKCTEVMTWLYQPPKMDQTALKITVRLQLPDDDSQPLGWPAAAILRSTSYGSVTVGQ